MKFALAIAASLLSLQCFANTRAFDIKAAVSIDGKLISSPHIVTKPNELASISQKIEGNKEILIEMTASDFTSKETKDGIIIKFTLSEISAGKKTAIAKPQIITTPGQSAEVTEEKAPNIESVNVKVIATRLGDSAYLKTSISDKSLKDCHGNSLEKGEACKTLDLNE
jgi:hypothetical protein